ncbi:MAG: hypothetical protein ACYCWW_01880 [Deltaproteobacteria bacterium]
MSERTLAHTAKEYGEAIGPHLAHPNERADDIPKRLLGFSCQACGIVIQIPIAEFKATGDLEAYQAAVLPFKPAEPKAAPKPAPA